MKLPLNHPEGHGPSSESPAAWYFVVWLICLSLIPFILILGMSFLGRTGYGSLIFRPTLENYLRCLDWIYIRVLVKTLSLAFLATVNCLVIGFPVAYYLARSKGKQRHFGLILLFIPFWTNFILRMFGLVSLLGNYGLINQSLMNLGIIQQPIQILYTRLGVYLGLLYNYLPFLVIPVFSSLEKFDDSLREAAQDLGASRLQTFIHVVLPNIKEGVFVGSLFVFIPMLGEYVIPDLLGGAKEAFWGNVMVSQFFVMQDWPFGSALAGVLSLLMLLALYLRTSWRGRMGLGSWTREGTTT